MLADDVVDDEVAGDGEVFGMHGDEADRDGDGTVVVVVVQYDHEHTRYPEDLGLPIQDLYG